MTRGRRPYLKRHQLTNLKVSPACYVLDMDEVLFSAFEVPNKAITSTAEVHDFSSFHFLRKTAFSLS
jgi:hypothetical protein